MNKANKTPQAKAKYFANEFILVEADDPKDALLKYISFCYDEHFDPFTGEEGDLSEMFTEVSSDTLEMIKDAIQSKYGTERTELFGCPALVLKKEGDYTYALTIENVGPEQDVYYLNLYGHKSGEPEDEISQFTFIYITDDIDLFMDLLCDDLRELTFRCRGKLDS